MSKFAALSAAAVLWHGAHAALNIYHDLGGNLFSSLAERWYLPVKDVEAVDIYSSLEVAPCTEARRFGSRRHSCARKTLFKAPSANAWRQHVFPAYEGDYWSQQLTNAPDKQALYIDEIPLLPNSQSLLYGRERLVLPPESTRNFAPFESTFGDEGAQAAIVEVLRWVEAQIQTHRYAREPAAIVPSSPAVTDVISEEDAWWILDDAEDNLDNFLAVEVELFEKTVLKQSETRLVAATSSRINERATDNVTNHSIHNIVRNSTDNEASSNLYEFRSIDIDFMLPSTDAAFYSTAENSAGSVDANEALSWSGLWRVEGSSQCSRLDSAVGSVSFEGPLLLTQLYLRTLAGESSEAHRLFIEGWTYAARTSLGEKVTSSDGGGDGLAREGQRKRVWHAEISLEQHESIVDLLDLARPSAVTRIDGLTFRFGISRDQTLLNGSTRRVLDPDTRSGLRPSFCIHKIAARRAVLVDRRTDTQVDVASLDDQLGEQLPPHFFPGVILRMSSAVTPIATPGQEKGEKTNKGSSGLINWETRQSEKVNEVLRERQAAHLFPSGIKGPLELHRIRFSDHLYADISVDGQVLVQQPRKAQSVTAILQREIPIEAQLIRLSDLSSTGLQPTLFMSEKTMLSLVPAARSVTPPFPIVNSAPAVEQQDGQLLATYTVLRSMLASLAQSVMETGPPLDDEDLIGVTESFPELSGVEVNLLNTSDKGAYVLAIDLRRSDLFKTLLEGLDDQESSISSDHAASTRVIGEIPALQNKNLTNKDSFAIEALLGSHPQPNLLSPQETAIDDPPASMVGLPETQRLTESKDAAATNPLFPLPSSHSRISMLAQLGVQLPTNVTADRATNGPIG